MIEIISRCMQDAVDSGVFPGAVLMCSKEKKIVCHRSYGYADIFAGKVMKEDTIFDLASLTKPFATALVTAHLIEKKRLRLDDEIRLHLEMFKDQPAGQVTIEMLLRHTSGLPSHKEYYRIISGESEPRNALRFLLLKEPLECAPGTRQNYSDLGFMILSWLIEHIAGERIDKLVQKYVCQPLGLDRLFYLPIEERSSLEPDFLDGIAATQICPWRGRLLKGEVDDENTWAVGGVEGHAGLFGDAESLHSVCVQLLDASRNKENILVNQHLFRMLIEKKNGVEMVAGFDTPSKLNSSAGNFFSPNSIGHLGYTGTSFWIDPDAQLIVILLTNRVHPSRSNQTIKKFRPEVHDLIHPIHA